MKKIGIVGLGIMGRGMADNFLQQGYEVYVWNRTITVSEPYRKKGALICDTPREVVANADIVFEVTANDESSRAVWTGLDGILAGAHSGSVLIASATLSMQWVDELIQLCAAKNLSFMDIALTGGRVGAESGNLTLLCGGEATTLVQIEPTLWAIAKTKKIFHFGPAGHGMRYKLILNFLQAVHMIGFGQAMKIAQAYNMDLQKVSEALVDRPGGAITGIAQKAYFTEPDPITFSIEWIAKDLAYAKKLAQDLDVTLLDEVLSKYQQAVADGHAQKDWAAVNKL